MSRPPAVAAALALLVLGGAACTSGGSVAGQGAASASSAQPGLDLTLLAASRDGDLAAVRSALAAGASVRSADDSGATALVHAAYGNHVEVAAALVAAGADVNHQDRTQQSPYLISTAEVGDDPRLLELLLAHGADVRAVDSYRGTGLIRAADRGFESIVRRLLAAGIDIDHVNRLGWTALLEAVILGGGDVAHERVVAVLVAAGADRGIRDHDGLTALDHARRSGYVGMIALLEAGPARPSSAPPARRTGRRTEGRTEGRTEDDKVDLGHPALMAPMAGIGTSD